MREGIRSLIYRVSVKLTELRYTDFDVQVYMKDEIGQEEKPGAEEEGSNKGGG